MDELSAAEDALQQALRTGDADALEALLADGVVHVGPDGAPVTRADDLAAHRSGAHGWQVLAAHASAVG